MKFVNCIALIVATLVLSSCKNELDMEMQPLSDPVDELNLTDGIIIGEKLGNPYSIEVMKRACDLLYPPTRGETPVSDSIIVPNVKYVRFLPTDSTQLNLLVDSDLELFNYPLDYDILGDPSDYHDPNLPPEQITWQYTVMPIDQTPPISNVEVLDVGFIPELTDPMGEYDLTAIDQTANDLVTNEFIKDKTEGAGIAGGESSPNDWSSMIIRVRDSDDPLSVRGVKGVKVRARNVWKIRTDYTDSLGRYYINLRELGGNNPRFELRFENKYGFKLGYGMDLILPVTYNMEGYRSFTFGKDELKPWVLCTINNAAYDWYKRCDEEGMPTPPEDLRIWAMKIAGGAACPMFHHNTLVQSGLSIYAIIGKYFGFDVNSSNAGFMSRLIEWVAPDVVIFDVDTASTATLYQSTCHELSHATHFQKLGSNDNQRASWWADVIQYEIACGIGSGGDPYEMAGVPHEGKAGVTEMWAHAAGNIMLYEFWGIVLNAYPKVKDYWFRPEIVWEMYKLGISLGDINRSMREDVVSLTDFKWQLEEDNPPYAKQIDSLFVAHL